LAKTFEYRSSEFRSGTLRVEDYETLSGNLTRLLKSALLAGVDMPKGI
jgi:hypothetical protein